MTKTDINNLFSLLKLYFPHSPQIKSAQTRNAWLLVLEPYDPADVKAALVERLREVPHFPDPQTIASKCPNPIKAQPEVKPSPVKLSDKEIKRINEFTAWIDNFLDTYDPNWRDRWDGDTLKSHAPGDFRHECRKEAAP